MAQTPNRRLVTEASLETVTAQQEGRLALVEAAAGFEAPPLGFEDSIITALISDPASGTKKELGKHLVGKGDLVINVCDFGAKGDWVSGSGGTDNLSAFQDAWAAAVAQGKSLFIPDGKYRLSGEWDIFRPNTGQAMTIMGQSREGTWLVSDFYGADKALVKNYDPLLTARGASTSYVNLQFRSTSRSLGVNPVFMYNGGWGESTMDHVKFGPSNNTHFRGTSLQNIRCMDTVSYYGGRNFLYKATDGITFTVALPGTITASHDVFTASDAGMLFFLSPPNTETRIMYRIASVVNAKTANIDTTETPAIAATVASKGNFDAALGTIAAGSNVLTANGPCFTPGDVGRVIVIQNARQGAYGKALLRAAITAYTSPTEVVLEAPADLSVVNTPFALPVFDVASPKGKALLSASSTDIKWNNMHLEAYAGLGLSIIDGLQWHINDQKIHGEHDPVDTRMSTGMAWFDDMAGVFSGEFDGGSHSNCRMYFSNMNDTLSIPFLSTRRVRNEPLFIAEDWTENGGFVGIGTLVVYRHDAAGPEKFVVDRGNTAGHGRKLAYLSTATMIGGTVAPRIYSGMGTYFTPEGRLIRNGTGATGFDVELGSETGGRMLFEDYGTRKYSIGNVAGGGSTFNLYDETVGAIRWLVNSNGDFTPGSASLQNLGSSTSKWKDFYAERTLIGGVSTSTGTGSPEGVVTAPRGSEYVDVNGAVGAVRWGKKSGTGNTGWVALW